MGNDSLLMAKASEAKGFDPASPIRPIQPARDGSERYLNALIRTVQRASCNGCAPSGEGIAEELIGMSPAHRALVMRGLQQTHGNRYAGRLAVQAKLAIGSPGDKYEREADRVADAVMRMPEPPIDRQRKLEKEEEPIQAKLLVDQITLPVQRQKEPEEKEEIAVQASPTSGYTPQVAPGLAMQIYALRQSGGQPLPAATRAFFEPRFGHDFSQVHIHSDRCAAESAQMVNARAFATGRDIVFATGQYAPWSNEGQRLLAHELTHVIQQRKAAKNLALRYFMWVMDNHLSYYVIK